MKKFFSTVLAVVAAMAINADNYYLGGINGQWPTPGDNPAFQLTGEGEWLSASFEKVNAGSEIKVFVGEGWGHTEYGKPSDDAVLTLSDPTSTAATTVTLAAGGGNLPIAIEDKHYIENATIYFNPTTLEVSISGTDVDNSAEPIYYYLIGACTNNWSLDDAVKFEEVEGVFTANVAKLEGGFKIIYDKKWGTEYASNGAGIVLGEAYNLQLGGGNLSLDNPFAGYSDAVLTLDTATKALTLVSGEFYVMENYWHIPGTKLGWNLNEETRFTPVEGKANTYEFVTAEFGGDFKIVYGTNWEVEFGSQKPLPEGETAITWAINAEPLPLYIKGDNLHCGAGDEVVYTDVIITIVVDYEAATVQLTLESEEAQAIENSKLNGKAAKAIVANELVIIKNGVRYNVLGARL